MIMPTASDGTIIVSLILSLLSKSPPPELPVPPLTSRGLPTWLARLFVSLSTISMINSLAIVAACGVPMRLTGRSPLILFSSPTILTWHWLRSCKSRIVSPPLPMINPTVRFGTIICVASSPARSVGWWTLAPFANVWLALAARVEVLLPFSSIIRYISALAFSRAWRVPVILHWRNGPLASGPVINWTLVAVSASTRRKFSPWRPIISPTSPDSMTMVSTLSSTPPPRRPWGDLSNPRFGGGEKPEPGIRPLIPGGEKDLSLVKPGPLARRGSSRRSSRYGL